MSVLFLLIKTALHQKIICKPKDRTIAIPLFCRYTVMPANFAEIAVQCLSAPLSAEEAAYIALFVRNKT